MCNWTRFYPFSWHAIVSLFTSSLLLVSNPTSLCRLCFSATPSKRNRDGSSLNARPMLTGLGPPAACSPSSEPNLPRLVRFSNRSLQRNVHGRPGKRAFATPWVLKPARVAGDDNPPPDAAIIYYNNTDGALAEGDSGAMRAKMDCADAKARDRETSRCIMGKRTSLPRELLFRSIGRLRLRRTVLLVSVINVLCTNVRQVLILFA